MQEVRPAQAFEECVTAFFIRCADILAYCNYDLTKKNYLTFSNTLWRLFV